VPVGTAPIGLFDGLACAAGIAFALLASHKTGKGQRLTCRCSAVGMH
jgi:formyl-CoA transferase/succinate--hydroxymethylglutarate CoA-transferase